MSIWSALDGGVIDELQARELAVSAHVRSIAWAKRWFDHYENRLAYERAMLDEQGGTPGNRFNIEVGGQVLIGREWLVVMRVNKSGETINSVSTNSRYCRVKSIEEIADYRAPSAENVAKVKAANKLPPLANYPGEGFKEVTAAQWKRMSSDYAFTRIVKRTETTGEHRARFIFGAGCNLIQAFITDAKRVDPPALPATPAEPVTFERELVATAPRPSCAPAEANEFDALREQLKAGVQVVSAPQLFPTPASLAEKMVQLAGIHRGARILEPSAGTGNIVRAVAQVLDLADTNFHAVEIDQSLAGKLQSVFPDVSVVCADFLECGPDRFDNFDVILMNPPFANAVDIMHIEHAFGMLKPGGRLVAICANGPRQNEKLRPMVEQLGGEWEDLPPDTFKESGTGVRAALILISRPAVDTLRACSTPANNYSATSAN